MNRDLTALPKVDLHVHLEGAIRPATLVELADGCGATMPPGLSATGYRFADFADFIANWEAVINCLRTPDDFRRIAHEFCEDEAAEGVRYAEVHFSLPRDGGRLADFEMPLLAVIDGLASGQAAFGITVQVIVDLVRGLPFELSRRAAQEAMRHVGAGVIGVGLGGFERHPPAPYRKLFAHAKDAGLRCTVHAGETEGSDSIRAALAAGAERIGHGIRVLDDPRLVEELVQRRVPLEVCPTSNVMTGAVAELADHPLPELLARGLVVTLNSDDPAMFGSPLALEYLRARETFGLTDDELAAVALAGVASSWASASLKAAIESGVDDWMKERLPGMSQARVEP